MPCSRHTRLISSRHMSPQRKPLPINNPLVRHTPSKRHRLPPNNPSTSIHTLRLTSSNSLLPYSPRSHPPTMHWHRRIRYIRFPPSHTSPHPMILLARQYGAHSLPHRMQLSLTLPPHSPSTPVTSPLSPSRPTFSASSDIVRRRTRCSSLYWYTSIGCLGWPRRQVEEPSLSTRITCIDLLSRGSLSPVNSSATYFTLIPDMPRLGVSLRRNSTNSNSNFSSLMTSVSLYRRKRCKNMRNNLSFSPSPSNNPFHPLFPHRRHHRHRQTPTRTYTPTCAYPLTPIRRRIPSLDRHAQWEP